MLLVRKCRSALRQPVKVLVLVPAAWFTLALASMLIALLPFKQIARLMGENAESAVVPPVPNARELVRAEHIGIAIRIAAANAPFRSNCLPQALVAATFCRIGKVPYAAYLGATLSASKGSSKLIAHAWVRSGRITLTGGGVTSTDYTPVVCFVRR